MAIAPIHVVFDTTEFDAKVMGYHVKMPRIVGLAMFTAAHAVTIPAIKQQIQKNRSVFRGELHTRISARSSVSSERDEKGKSISGTMLSADDAMNPVIEIGALGVPYAMNVEVGAPPHSPNPKKILDYVKKKMGKDGDEAKLIAAKIIDTIEEEGTKPHPFILNTWEVTAPIFMADTIARIRAALAKL